MNAILKSILDTGNVTSSEGETIHALYDGISREQGEFLQAIIAEIKPASSVEIGLAYGVSSLFILDALRQIGRGHHIIMDYKQSTLWKSIGLKNLNDAGFADLYEFYEQPAHVGITQLEMQGTKVDFAFIDGKHLYDYTLVDFFCVDRILKVGGIVAMDDMWMPSIQKVCAYILTNRAYTVYRTHCPGTNPIGSFKRRLLHEAAKRSPKVANMLETVFSNPDVQIKLGLPNSRWIAFKKEADDTRLWDYHDRF
jgi:predicted O-methyltransferase YrrM